MEIAGVDDSDILPDATGVDVLGPAAPDADAGLTGVDIGDEAD